MKLFSKLKDYNNLLEEILDRKTFSSISKSLLLSMIYKLEISYKDYETVKIDTISKDEFLSHLLEVIEMYCDHIKTVEPESSQATLLIENKVEAVTNSKERSILTYPTERAMLYAICDIEPKYFFLKKSFLLKDVLQKVLVDGYKQNAMEILKNFSGWSWDINPKEKVNFIANIIYQNLMMIKGEEFLYNWRRDDMARENYLDNLKYSIRKVTSNDAYYDSLCKLLYCIADEGEKRKIEKKLEESGEEFDYYREMLNHTKSERIQLAELQNEFLKYLTKKIERTVLREEILEIIYEFRYYQNLVVSEGVLIKKDSNLQKTLDDTLKLLITKACKMGILKIMSMDIETNFRMIQYILDTRIIDLEEVKVYLEIEESTVLIKVYDKGVFEKQIRKEFSGNKKDIVFKKKKIVKLFN